MKSVLLTVLILTGILSYAQQPATLKIKVNLAGSNQSDTLYFSFQKPGNSRSADLKNLTTAIREDGLYNFSIESTDTCGYFTLHKNRKNASNQGATITEIVNPQFWRNGDSITANIKYTESEIGVTEKLLVTGKGAEKYNISRAIDSIRATDSSTASASENRAQLFKHPDQNAIDRSLSFLKNQKEHLDQFEYNVIKANITCINGKFVFMRINEYFNRLKTEKERKNFIQYYDQHIAQLISTDIPDNALVNSNYVYYLLIKLWDESILKTGKEDFEWIYTKIKAYREGLLRDRLLAIGFLILKKPSNLDYYVKDALGQVSDSSSRNIISGFSKFVAGSNFNSYSLEDITGNKIFLDSLMNNKIVIMDFWQNGCGPCASLFKNAIHPNEEFFVKDGNILFISVNLDKKKEQWLRGLQNGIYTSEHAANLTTGISGFNHPIWVENKMNGTPKVLVIDKHGKIASYNAQQLYTAEGLKEAILALK